MRPLPFRAPPSAAALSPLKRRRRFPVGASGARDFELPPSLALKSCDLADTAARPDCCARGLPLGAGCETAWTVGEGASAPGDEGVLVEAGVVDWVRKMPRRRSQLSSLERTSRLVLCGLPFGLPPNHAHSIGGEMPACWLTKLCVREPLLISARTACRTISSLTVPSTAPTMSSSARHMSSSSTSKRPSSPSTFSAVRKPSSPRSSALTAPCGAADGRQSGDGPRALRRWAPPCAICRGENSSSSAHSLTSPSMAILPSVASRGLSGHIAVDIWFCGCLGTLPMPMYPTFPPIPPRCPALRGFGRTIESLTIPSSCSSSSKPQSPSLFSPSRIVRTLAASRTSAISASSLSWNWSLDIPDASPTRPLPNFPPDLPVLPAVDPLCAARALSSACSSRVSSA
mmetsp:Transcript_42350/g.95686  ORF Transcript_42350/g.95686 Transcript_42350/m.95686 type:complete len:401 (-) Transcript_42350:565-1767(-)